MNRAECQLLMFKLDMSQSVHVQNGLWHFIPSLSSEHEMLQLICIHICCRVKELKAKYDPDNLFRDLDYYRPHIGNTDAYSSQDYDPSRSS